LPALPAGKRTGSSASKKNRYAANENVNSPENTPVSRPAARSGDPFGLDLR
jgi:hypothetical protein